MPYRWTLPPVIVPEILQPGARLSFGRMPDAILRVSPRPAHGRPKMPSREGGQGSEIAKRHWNASRESRARDAAYDRSNRLPILTPTHAARPVFAERITGQRQFYAKALI